MSESFCFSEVFCGYRKANQYPGFYMIGICVIKRVKRLTYYCLQLANINDYGVYPEALVLSYVKKISINTTFIRKDVLLT